MDDETRERFERIERRLDRLDGRFIRPPAPPVVLPPAPAVEDEDLETALAARWLPRAGATAVIAALAYLVSLGLERGAITPAMVAAGIALACGAVASLGTRMRGARETFGNVLVGLGAGGLYVDAVGSNGYHELLSGEATVAVCLTIGLATLAFGARRALPSFLGVGLVGGLLAALMPLSKGAVAASSGLFLVATVPTFAVAATRRWPMVVAGAWLAAFLGALTILFSPGAIAPRLVPLDAALMMALAAWSFAAEPLPKEDPRGAFPFASAAVTALAALAVLSGRVGAGHLALLGAALVLGGGVSRGRATGGRVLFAGLLVALGIAPLGLTPLVAATVLATLALAEAAFLRLVASTADDLIEKGVGLLVAAQAVLALGAYGVAALTPIGALHEEAVILLVGLAVMASAALLARVEARVAAGVVVWGLATRLGVVGLALQANAAITVAWIAVLAGLLAVGFARRQPELRQLGLAVAAATAAKVVLVDLTGLDAALKAAVLLGLGIVLLGGGYAYVRANR